MQPGVFSGVILYCTHKPAFLSLHYCTQVFCALYVFVCTRMSAGLLGGPDGGRGSRLAVLQVDSRPKMGVLRLPLPSKATALERFGGGAHRQKPLRPLGSLRPAVGCDWARVDYWHAVAGSTSTEHSKVKHSFNSSAQSLVLPFISSLWIVDW